MAAPANNPFGAPPPQVTHNPFGTPTSNQLAFAATTPAHNLFSGSAFTGNPRAAPASNVFGTAAPMSVPSKAPNNVFGAPSGRPSVSPSSSRQPSPATTQIPFGNPAAQAQPNQSFGAAHTGRFGGGQGPSLFTSKAPPTGPSSQLPAGAANGNAMARQNKFIGGKPPAVISTGVFGGRAGQNTAPQHTTPFGGAQPFSKQPSALPTEPGAKATPGPRSKQLVRQERQQLQRPQNRQDRQNTSTGKPTEHTKEISPFAFDYANRLYERLGKENLSPPQWPAEPGNPNKRAGVENFKEAYKKYRSRVYATLRKADLIDDPEKRRKLEDALPFKGVCEDMCPDFEKVRRIAEHDVNTEEKTTGPDGLTLWPDISRMVKKFGRSAAGQDAPLPEDVRSVDALRRTTDYLFNDLLQSENNLPSMHNFLWDRTRAVRKDFTFHSQKSAEEMKEMVYCFETITRFHATALHLLSRKGFANEDFDQRQEIEQLGRTILSLIEAYDVCRDKRVGCENEPEFRAYYLLLNAHDPSIARRIPAWGKEYWFDSEEVQTALSLIQAMQDVREPQGPIKPRRPTALADTSFTNFFSIVEDTRVSYTMACIAEIHFTSVRQGILKNLVRGYARYRDAPRTITASDLNAMLRFDTPEEAVEFAELHDFEFSTWVPPGKNPVDEPYLLLDHKKKHVPSPRVRQSFSGKVVERKRTTQSLPHVIHNTVFEELAKQSPSSVEEDNEGLFVTRTVPDNSFSGGTSSFAQPAKPPVVAAVSSPSGAAVQSTAFSSAPVTTSAPAPAFAGFQTSKPSAPASSSAFANLSQPTTQASTSAFSFPNKAQIPPNTDAAPTPASFLGQPGRTSAPSIVPSKLPEAAKPFEFLKGFGSTTAPSLPTTTASPASSAPSPLATTTPTLNAGHSPPHGSSSAPGQPAGSAPSSSLAASTSRAAVLPSSATPFAKPAEQTISAAPAVPPIFVSPPSTTSTPPIQNLQSTFLPTSTKPPKPTTLPGSTSQPPAVTASLPPRAPPAPPRNLKADFTKWFVGGDDGLLEQFTEETLRVMVWDVWENFQREEAERIRREEDEKSWRVAREHQTYRLRVKYFYRWRRNARSHATKRILREGKEKMRLYREQQQAIQGRLKVETEKAEKEARRAAKRQLVEDSHRLSLLATSVRRRGSVALSADHNPEEQLIASGIFSGLRDDPRSVARRVVQEAAATNGSDVWAMASGASRSFRYPESELELGPSPSQRDDSPDTSSVGGRREGWKTRSLREKFGIEPRRSLSASGSVVNGGSVLSSSSRFRQSLPGNSTTSNHKTTNFSRKRSAEDGESATKRQSVLHGGHSPTTTNGLARSRHWDLRARGFVPTPDGNWVPEAIAKAGKARGQRQEASESPPTLSSTHLQDGFYHDPELLPDRDRAAPSSPTPSDLRLRLARLKSSRPHAPNHHRHHSVDLPPPPPRFAAAATTEGWLLATPSPPHPPFAELHSAVSTSAAGSGGVPIAPGMPLGPPPARMPPGIGPGMHARGKRKRAAAADGDLDMDSADDVESVLGRGREREMSPSAKKRANLANESGFTGDVGLGEDDESSALAVPGREETSAMVANTRRMLRELREFMDQVDREEQGAAAVVDRAGTEAEVYLRGGGY